ncbi:MAG: DUF47 family protein [Smithellaceae bacterium]|nr:DUF47 family protein [Smithellaceae bacterium]
MKLDLLKNTDLEGDIDIYLDMIIRGGLLFCQGVKFYLEGREDEFNTRLDILAKLENKADAQLNIVEGKLFNNEGMREWRGDILGLIENSDEVLDRMNQTLKQFSVEMPAILPELTGSYQGLCQDAISTVEAMVAAIRAYFRKPNLVRGKIEEVIELRKTTVRAADWIKRKVFRSDIDLDHKFHLRYFAHHIEEIVWQAERVCDRLAIATIKRYS